MTLTIRMVRLQADASLQGVVRWGLLAAVACMLAGGTVQAQEETQYKRRGLNAMALISDGAYDEAIAALERHLDAYPGDPEFYYGLAVAYTGKGDLDAALAYARRAVATGLPMSRLLAGPRALLDPLTSSSGFRAWVAERPVTLLHGPLLGSVTDSTAHVWVRTAEAVPVSVAVWPEAQPEAVVRSEAVATRAEDDYTAVVPVCGLRPDTRYRYQVYVDGQVQPEEWAFRTFPVPGASGQLQVGFGGCAGYTPWHEHMWRTIAARQLPAFLMLGDNVYIDHPEHPLVQQYCYYRRQSRPEFQALTARTAIYAIWDDHDFTVDDGWGGPATDVPAWKRPVWRIFRQNWNNPAYGGGEAQPGVWFRFTIGDVDFFMLDGRYYRTDPEQEAPSMLGPVQLAWLRDALQASSATFKVIASPVPWARGTKPGSLDTWDGYAGEREALFSFLEANRIDGVVLLSADRHRSDVWKIERPDDYDLYEFQSGRLTNIHTHESVPGALFSYNEKPSFGLLTFDTARPDPSVTYEIVNLDGETVHTITLLRSQLSDQP